MLTVYDPDVSNRPSILKVTHLGRPQSARTLKASPWDQVVKHKGEGRLCSPLAVVNTHDLRGYPPVKVNTVPNKGERGVRTDFPHHCTTNKSITGIVYAPPQTKKDSQLYVDRRIRGIRIPCPPTAETVQKKQRYAVKPGGGRPAQRTLQIPYPPGAHADYEGYWADGRPKCKSHPHVQYVADNVQLHHDSTWKSPPCRPLGSPQSNEAKTHLCFATKTAIRRNQPMTLDQRMHTPYGTEVNRDLNLAQRRCYHFDTSQLISYK